MTALLALGDEAFCLLLDTAGTRSRSGTRHMLRGVARVRIEAIEGDVYRGAVISASGGVPGERLERGCTELYATSGEEARVFGELVSWYWGTDTARKTASPPRHPIVATGGGHAVAAGTPVRGGGDAGQLGLDMKASP